MKPVGDRQSVASDREVLAGLVERVTFHNPENGFCVLRTKARGHRDLVTIVGHAAMVSPGEWITASGEWNNDRTHGQQFKARFLRISPPGRSCSLISVSSSFPSVTTMSQKSSVMQLPQFVPKALTSDRP